MSNYFGLARVGRDVTVRQHEGSAVANVSLAFNYGKKNSEGKRSTQWVDAVLWGSRADSLSPYLVKGTSVTVVLKDVHIEEYQGQQGMQSKLTGQISEIELVSVPQQDGQQNRSSQQGNQQNYQQRGQMQSQQRQQSQNRGQQQRGGRQDFDDDIPF